MGADVHIAGSLPEFIQQYLRDLLLILLFAILVAIGFSLKRLPGWIRSLRAGSWPTTEGRIETVEVKAFGEQALGELGYSYVVEASRYSGYYSRQFADEQHAWDHVNKLRGQMVVVRYSRGDPQVSVLRNADQQSYVDLKGRSFLSSFLGAFFERLRESLYPRRL